MTQGKPVGEASTLQIVIKLLVCCVCVCDMCPNLWYFVLSLPEPARPAGQLAGGLTHASLVEWSKTVFDPSWIKEGNSIFVVSTVYSSELVVFIDDRYSYRQRRGERETLVDIWLLHSLRKLLPSVRCVRSYPCPVVSASCSSKWMKTLRSAVGHRRWN